MISAQDLSPMMVNNQNTAQVKGKPENGAQHGMAKAPLTSDIPSQKLFKPEQSSRDVSADGRTTY